MRSRPRSYRMPVALLALAVMALEAVPGVAQVPNELFNIPKDAKGLEWDWYTKDFRDITFMRMPGLSPDYRIGVGDEIQVMVVGVDHLDTYKVRPDGDIVMPLVGSIKIADLTAEEAESSIGATLKAKDLVKNPEVLIFVASYEAKRFYVYGQVDRPGEYTMSQSLTVMDAIFMAGGLDFYGDRYAFLHRRLRSAAAVARQLTEQPERPIAGSEVIRIDLQAMREGKVLSPNPVIEAGDALVVPTRYPTVFYILGDVLHPGPFQLNNGEPLTVSQAVSHAGGPTKTAKKGSSVIRYADDGSRQDIRFDYNAILRGEQPDIAVRSNDVIFVPGSPDKTFGLGMLGLLPAVLATTGSAATGPR